MRFHLDEQVTHAISRGLRARGIDVTTTTDAGLISAADDAYIAFARDQQRVIFTQDADFLRMAHAGIVYCPHGTASIGHIVRFLGLMNDCVAAEEMVGRVEFI